LLPSLFTFAMAKFNLWIVRVAILGWLLFCSLLVLGISAHAVSETLKFGFGAVVADYVSLSLAVSVITLVVATPLLVVDFMRKGAITSWVLVELAATGFLWVMWIAAAGSSSGSVFSGINCSAFGVSFSNIPDLSDFGLKKRGIFTGNASFCRQIQAMIAFSWLAWIAVFSYFIVLLVFAIIAANRGNGGVWKSSVRDTDFLAPSAASKNAVPMTQQYATQPQQGYGTPVQGYNNTPTPQPQYTGPSQYAAQV